jgi:hypothetical protein
MIGFTMDWYIAFWLKQMMGAGSQPIAYNKVNLSSKQETFWHTCFWVQWE